MVSADSSGLVKCWTGCHRENSFLVERDRALQRKMTNEREGCRIVEDELDARLVVSKRLLEFASAEVTSLNDEAARAESEKEESEKVFDEVS